MSGATLAVLVFSLVYTRSSSMLPVQVVGELVIFLVISQLGAEAKVKLV